MLPPAYQAGTIPREVSSSFPKHFVEANFIPLSLSQKIQPGHSDIGRLFKADGPIHTNTNPSFIKKSKRCLVFADEILDS